MKFEREAVIKCDAREISQDKYGKRYLASRTANFSGSWNRSGRAIERSIVAGIRTRTCLGIVRVLKTFLKTHRSTRIVPDARHYDITLVSG